jgi:hypothetical protein
VVLPAGQMLLVVAFFPRSETITAGDKDLVLESSDGMVEVAARFNPRKMVYKGSLEL